MDKLFLFDEFIRHLIGYTYARGRSADAKKTLSSVIQHLDRHIITIQAQLPERILDCLIAGVAGCF